MRSNLENNVIRAPRIYAPSHGIVRLALTGVFVIPPEGPTMVFLDPGAVDRTVYLPAITPAAGQEHYIINLSSSKNLNVVDSNGIAVVTINPNRVMLFLSYIGGWKYLNSVSDVLDQTSLWTTHNVTSNSFVIPATASEVFVNFTGPVTLTLPDVAAWYALHTLLTSNLLILDVSGAASTNNITVARAGADVVNGLTSLSILSDYAGFTMRRVAAGKWGLL